LILVIDNYDSFTYNLVHLVAAQHRVEVRRNDAIGLEEIREMMPTGILISPGPGRPADAGMTETIVRELGGEFPILGICLGHQAIGEVYGGRVVHAPVLMHGKTSHIRHDGLSVFAGLDQDFVATRYHSLVIDPDTLPDNLLVTATAEDGSIMGLRHRTFPSEGIQFHPESILTSCGPAIIENWLRDLSGEARPDA
jgi:anthranilate synthase component 2